MSIDSQMKLKTAGWRIALGTNPPSSYEWSRDGIDWYTEDEALVVVLTAERDAAIARAERAEAERDDANGRRDLVCAAMLMVGCELAGDPKIDPRNRRDARHTPTLLLAAEVRARAEAADDRREPMTWGRPVTDADGDRYRDLFAGLTPDEVRVITGLVMAMRESKPQTFTQAAWGHLDDAKDAIEDASEMGLRADNAERTVAHAAWHIAHAIAQMGES